MRGLYHLRVSYFKEFISHSLSEVDFLLLNEVKLGKGLSGTENYELIVCFASTLTLFLARGFVRFICNDNSTEWGPSHPQKWEFNCVCNYRHEVLVPVILISNI